MNDVLQGLRLLLAALLAALLACPGASADTTELQERPVKREILALYDGAQEGGANATRIHRFAELPLNHLGYILRYRDVRAGLLEPREAAHFAGVLTWFVGPLTDGDAYLAWAARAAREGPRLVVLGDLGAVVTARNLQLANRVMSRFGLRHTGDYVSPADGSRITRRDHDLYEFECRLDPVLADYPIIETDSTEPTIGLQLAVPAHEGDKTSTLVAIGERGGFAAFNYEFCHQRPPLDRGKWLINPFAFFRAAMGARTFPIPDTTTVSGRRIYFSLVDSDGWSVPFESERGWQAHQIAVELVVRELPGHAARQARRRVEAGASRRELRLHLQPNTPRDSQHAAGDPDGHRRRADIRGQGHPLAHGLVQPSGHAQPKRATAAVEARQHQFPHGRRPEACCAQHPAPAPRGRKFGRPGAASRGNLCGHR